LKRPRRSKESPRRPRGDVHYSSSDSRFRSRRAWCCWVRLKPARMARFHWKREACTARWKSLVKELFLGGGAIPIGESDPSRRRGGERHFPAACERDWLILPRERTRN